MTSIFHEFNEQLRRKLIALYEDFIINPKDEILKENAATITEKYCNAGSHITQEVSFALNKAYSLESGELSVEEAKKILEKLKKDKAKYRSAYP